MSLTDKNQSLFDIDKKCSKWLLNIKIKVNGEIMIEKLFYAWQTISYRLEQPERSDTNYYNKYAYDMQIIF